ncbi:hypothetical protein D5J11_001266 [Escherichia coli]|nr:hypothetical protein [Escherichia coli]EEW9447813.1 hypothetical protein [Escherichia coli]
MSRYKTGHKQPRFRYSVLARCVAWANISVQVLFPLAVTFTPVMAARAQHAVQPRLSMGNTTVTADNNVEKNVASFAANAGTFLSSQPDSEVTLTASPASLNLEPNGTATTNEQGQAIFTATTTVAAIYTLKAQVSQTNGQVSTKTAESKFVADDKNAVLTASSDMQSLVADGKSTAKLEVTLMSANNPVGGNMWVDIQTPEGVTEKDYQFLPSKNDHFVSGKITRKFSTSKPGVYTFTFNALTYGGYEMKPVTVTITAVDADTAKDEEAMK